MTTIAWDGRTLAADTLVSANGLRDARSTKIWRRGRVLFGATGSSPLAERFRSWVIAGMDGKDPYHGADDGNGLIVTRDSAVCFGPDGPWSVRRELFYALGSGYPIAMGAMSAGADARRAVEIAIEHDTKSGGPITVLTLD